MPPQTTPPQSTPPPTSPKPATPLAAPPKQQANPPPKPPPIVGEKKGLEDYIKTPGRPKKQEQAPPPEPPKPPKESPPAAPPDDGGDDNPPPELPSKTPETPDDKSGSIDDLLTDFVKKPDAPTPTDKVGSGPKELREAYQKLKAENEAYKQRVAEAEKLKERAAQFEALAKERDDLAQKLAFAKYEDSPEYHEKYRKPFQDAVEGAYKLAKRLPAEEGVRMGTPDDVNELYRLWQSNPANAVAKARDVFGDSAQIILDRVQSLAEANEKSTAAIESWKSEAGKRKEMEAIESQRRVQQVKSIWEQSIASDRESVPDLFGEPEEPELKSIYNRSAHWADKAFWGDPEASMEDAVRVQARIRNWATAAPVLAKRLHTANAKITELESRLAEFDGAQPRLKSEARDGAKGPKPKGLAALESYLKPS